MYTLWTPANALLVIPLLLHVLYNAITVMCPHKMCFIEADNDGKIIIHGYIILCSPYSPQHAKIKHSGKEKKAVQRM